MFLGRFLIRDNREALYENQQGATLFLACRSKRVEQLFYFHNTIFRFERRLDTRRHCAQERMLAFTGDETERASDNLAHALARDPIRLADLFQCFRMRLFHTETRRDDIARTARQTSEKFFQRSRKKESLAACCFCFCLSGLSRAVLLGCHKCLFPVYSLECRPALNRLILPHVLAFCQVLPA